jgi:hypothetical protein
MQDRAPPSQKVAVFVMVSETVQLLVFVLNSKFPWGRVVFDMASQLQNLQMQNPLISLGYTMYLIAFWVLTSIVVACLGICVYVGYSFRENKFTLLWPIIFVRRVFSLFVTILFTSTLNMFLSSWDCKTVGQAQPMLMQFGATVEDDLRVTYSIPCWQMPHAMTAIMGATMSVSFAALALVLSLVDFETDMRSHHPLGSADARAEAMFFVAKITMAVCSGMMSGYPMFLAIMFAITSSLMTGAMMWLLPYRVAWVNKFRTALFSVITFSSLVLVAVVVRNDSNDNSFVVLEGVGIVPAFAAGWYAMGQRIRLTDGRRLLANPKTGGSHPKYWERAQRGAGFRLFRLARQLLTQSGDSSRRFGME